MARTEMKSLFTAITEEECATVSGGLTIYIVGIDLTQPIAQNLAILIRSVPSNSNVDTSAGAIAAIQQDVIAANNPTSA